MDYLNYLSRQSFDEGFLVLEELFGKLIRKGDWLKVKTSNIPTTPYDESLSSILMTII